MDWLGITENSFYYYINRHRDKSIWIQENTKENNQENTYWKLLDSISNHDNDKGVEVARLGRKEGCEFQLTKMKKPAVEREKYTLIGKGSVDG